MYFCKISGIYEYKLYLQTPPYRLGEKPEGSGVGSADNLFFEDIHIIADVPGYASAEPGRDIFGMFILNSNIGCISLKNITYVCPETVRPNTYLIVLGPLSNLRGDVEIFDPYASGTTDTLALENITCNGKPVTNVDEIVKVVAFDDINKDGFSSGRGRANTILLDGRKVR